MSVSTCLICGGETEESICKACIEDAEAHYCPNCGEQWGTEEIACQECDHCGYPCDEPDEDVCLYCLQNECECYVGECPQCEKLLAINDHTCEKCASRDVDDKQIDLPF
jgi:hypothetical protein